MTNRVRLSIAALAASVGMGATAAMAGPIYSFSRLSGTNDVNVADQLSMEVEMQGSTHVEFTFRNTGTTPSSITGIYFDDGTLLGLGDVVGGSGSSMSRGAVPWNLPGGDAIDFNTSAAHGADGNTFANGVGPGDSVTIRFDLIFGQSANDTFSALAMSLANPGVDMTDGLRVGLVVQGLDEGDFDTFINGSGEGGGPGPAIPLPSAAAMGMVGLAVMARRRRRLD